MARRRMFSLNVVDTDKFLDMPPSTQALYFNLGMRADDDGFVSSPKKITKSCNCDVEELNLLIAKGFIILFESGIVAISDWLENNYIQNDRYTKTKYIEEAKKILIVNKHYVSDTECIQLGYNVDTQVRLDQYKPDKNKSKTSNKESFDDFINAYTEDEQLKNSLNNYIKMRNVNNSYTLEALNLELEELNKIATNDLTKIEIVNQSIKKAWKGFYTLGNDKTERELPDWYTNKDEEKFEEVSVEKMAEFEKMLQELE